MTPRAGHVHRLSVAITRSEVARLERCVKACRAFADEVVVVDSGSDDDTVELARKLGCTVYKNPCPGYGAQRNLAADRARHDSILWVDADEIVGGELTAALQGWKRRAAPQPVVFRVDRVGDFMGRWLEGASEKSDHVARFDRYTTLKAEKARAAGRTFTLWRLIWRPPARLLKCLVLQGLYRNGIPGLIVCLLWVNYELMRELKLHELEWHATGTPEDSESDVR